MELQNFPFDVQDFKITFDWNQKFYSMWNRIDFVQYHVDGWGTLDLNLENCPIQEWTVHSPVVEISKGKQCTTIIRFKMQRSPANYLGK